MFYSITENVKILTKKQIKAMESETQLLPMLLQVRFSDGKESNV